MKMNNIDYPHPLLQESNDDYVDCCFDIEIDEEQTAIKDDDIQVAINYSLECEGLEKMVTNGTAKVIVTVQSVALSFRKNYDFMNGTKTGCVKIPKNNVSDKIEITGYVVAAEEIKKFSLPEHNQDFYKSASFTIRKGDILAKSTQRDIAINDSELEKPLSSIFNISEEEGLDMKVFPIFEDHKIEIKLSPEIYSLYFQLREYNNGSFRRALAGLVVLPVLTEAIDKMIGNLHEDTYDENMLDKRWHRAIDKKLRNMNIDLDGYSDSSAGLASKLLGDVVGDALSSFKAVVDDELSGDEIIRIGGED